MNNIISELICTRISHDLIGNIGAVSNAVELLEEGDMDFLDDIKSILKTSSSVLSARLKFFRMAFGLANANLEDIEQVQEVTKAYLNTVGGKNSPTISFKLSDTQYSKAIMLIVMAISDLLVKGGKIEVWEQGEKVCIAVEEEARLATEKLAQSLSVLKGECQDFSAQDAPILYLLEVCRAGGFKLSCSRNPVLSFILE